MWLSNFGKIHTHFNQSLNINRSIFDREHRSRGPRNYFDDDDDDDEGTFLNLALKKPGRDQIVIEIH